MARNQAAIDAQVKQFVEDFDRLLKMAGRNAEFIGLDVTERIGKSLVMYTPVGNPTLWKHKPPKGYVGGRLRANWQHGFNIRPSGTINKVDKTGQATVDKLTAQIRATAGHAGVHYFVNNLPYAGRIEYDGHSSQAPSGMVGITMIEFHRYVQEEAAKALARGLKA